MLSPQPKFPIKLLKRWPSDAVSTSTKLSATVPHLLSSIADILIYITLVLLVDKIKCRSLTCLKSMRLSRPKIVVVSSRLAHELPELTGLTV